MTDLAKSGDGRRLLTLPASLDLTAASWLKQNLEKALAEGTGLDIDAGSVQRVTSPCLQVLAAAVKSFQQVGGPAMRFSAVSPAMSEIASVLALEEALSLRGE
jgi:anti-anti-sigma regulatory factor